MAQARRAETIVKRGARLVLPAVLLAGALPAQPDPGAAGSGGELVLLDQVVALVGDSVILRSTLEATMPSFVSAKEIELGRALQPAERQALQLEVLRELINQHCLAQAAKTLGILPSAQVEEWFRARMQELEQEQVRQLGSYNALSRELALQNRTWQSFEAEQRLQEMSRLTEELTVWARLRSNRGLLITPKMMRDFYRTNRHLYSHGPQVDLAQVAVPIRRSRSLALQKAEEAAGIWRQEDLSSKELAERLPDYAQALPDVLDLREDDPRPLQSFFVEFALQSAAGEVSEPIEREGVFWVLKVLGRREGQDRPFSDAEVQADIRRRLESRVLQNLRLQAIERSRRRTHIWIPRIWIR